ncbi:MULTISPECIES: hypothetical protein [unclassified Nonomuraea]|uniref:hypothetical protein n=1 Tax=unclassified Nonomuraea TaxID=2593643 RepID=UPI0033E88F57
MDQRSLLTARADTEDVEGRLEPVVRRAVGAVSGSRPVDREQPGAEFDAEYAVFAERAATAFETTLREVGEHARRLREAARTHAGAARVNEDLARHLTGDRHVSATEG